MISVGLALTVFWVLARVDAAVGSAEAIDRFTSSSSESARGGLDASLTVDMSLWSDKRIAAFKEALGLAAAVPIGVLRVPRVGLEAPVFRGTDEVTLNRGVGWIEGTANPGTQGNAGIAGHRDGFFRALKDVQVDDVIELETSEGKSSFVIRSLTVVTPDRVDVLAPTSGASLTLVTCHPFYFVGSAPERFIVHATRVGEPGAEGEADALESIKEKQPVATAND